MTKRKAPKLLNTRLPVTLLSGFLGAGKTTLLKHILTNKDHQLKCAVIVNDMASLNIDAALIINDKTSTILHKEEKLVQMQNGCICCTLREDLLEEVARLANEKRFDYLVIESTGISEPMQVAETFTMVPQPQEENDEEEDDEREKQKTKKRDAKGQEKEGQDHKEKTSKSFIELNISLNELSYLDTCVTVIDCFTFLSLFDKAAFLHQEFDADKNDARNVTDLLVDQIEFANVILLNKTDLVPPSVVATVRGIVTQLNPLARIIVSQHSKVDLNEIINSKRFDMEQASMTPGWLLSMKEAHIPETEEYGISSFVYKARRPFHPQRLHELVIDQMFVMEPADDDHDHQDEDEDDDEYEDEDDQEDNMKIEEHKPHEKTKKLNHGKLDGDNKNETDNKESNKPAKKSKHQDNVPESDNTQDENINEDNEDEEDDEHPFIDPRDAQERLTNKQKGVFRNVVRSKGFLWIATRPKNMGEWSQAGLMLTVKSLANWYCEIDENEWPDNEDIRLAIKDDFEGENGDKRQEIVFIGQFGDKEKEKKEICDALDLCLCTDEEMKQVENEAFDDWFDPFEPWMYDDGEERDDDDENSMAQDEEANDSVSNKKHDQTHQESISSKRKRSGK